MVIDIGRFDCRNLTLQASTSLILEAKIPIISGLYRIDISGEKYHITGKFCLVRQHQEDKMSSGWIPTREMPHSRGLYLDDIKCWAETSDRGARYKEIVTQEVGKPELTMGTSKCCLSESEHGFLGVKIVTDSCASDVSDDTDESSHK